MLLCLIGHGGGFPANGEGAAGNSRADFIVRVDGFGSTALPWISGDP